ncbi:ABC transporter substrate-binding protein [Amycolatopsis pithecellobii]|uniref:Transporter substrate-binding domain-containing protein n=1 Tax=Amycolatopsis pithecellobii TaxID=664692 RepID=A0A6N7Z6M1_9PSEU|nr:ABC transporter substrate-binding protein [Amycolatopsis pithecellobii]MTD56574.1 transporter substrate-binding domain-containing protein [Amycolatopsis pithecellobii]
MRTRTRLAAGALGALAAVLLTACGSGSTASSPTPAPVNVSRIAQIADRLPADLKSKGTLTMVTDTTAGPPIAYKTDSGQIEGMEPDLAKAVGSVLGLKVDVVSASSTAFIPGLLSRRYDVAMSGIADLKSREAQVNFVDYYQSGVATMVRAGSEDGISTNDTLCGKKVGVIEGSYQENTMKEQNKQCPPGKLIDIQSFQDGNTMLQALSTGRVNAVQASSASAAYMVKSSAQFKVVGPTPILGYSGAEIAKDRTELFDAFTAAMTYLLENGQYKAILGDKWGQPEPNLVTSIVTNHGLNR